MVSTMQLKKEGKQVPNELANKFLKKALLEQGHKISTKEHNGENFELWGYPKDKPTHFYLVRGVKKKLILLSSCKINKYLIETSQDLLLKEKSLQIKIDRLQRELSSIRSKKNKLEENTISLTEFMQTSKLRP